MLTRRFALIFGIIYVVVGLMGFVPAFRSGMPMGNLSVTAQAGNLLGLFPVNVLHNIVHLLIGLVGIGASRSFTGARGYARGLAILYALLAVMGILPIDALRTTFGLIPLGGNDWWLHAASALVAAYFGWIAPGEVASVDASRVARGR